MSAKATGYMIRTLIKETTALLIVNLFHV